MAKGNKGRGNRYELEIRKLFRELGFNECETSRYASRKLDDAKVDLTDTGRFNVQCKWYSLPENPLYYHKELQLMPIDNKYNVIYHKIRGDNQYVIMSEVDWMEIENMLRFNYLPSPEVEWSMNTRRYNYYLNPIEIGTVISHYHLDANDNFSIMRRETFDDALKILIQNKIL